MVVNIVATIGITLYTFDAKAVRIASSNKSVYAITTAENVRLFSIGISMSKRPFEIEFAKYTLLRAEVLMAHREK